MVASRGERLDALPPEGRKLLRGQLVGEVTMAEPTPGTTAEAVDPIFWVHNKSAATPHSPGSAET